MREKRGFEKFGKKGQLTIFIILGIAIVVVFLLLFLNNKSFASLFVAQSPVEKIEACVRESLDEGMDIVMMQGGAIEPENYFLYEGNKVEYICYNEESFQKCVMQKPLLKQEIESELGGYIQPLVRECVEDVKESYRGSASVTSKVPEVVVDIVPGDVMVSLDIDLKIAKGDDVKNYQYVQAGKSSKLYDFVILTSKIANFEAEFGDSEILSMMLVDKWVLIEKYKQGDGSTVYILSDRDSDESFMFASKSIPIPPGWIEVGE